MANKMRWQRDRDRALARGFQGDLDALVEKGAAIRDAWRKLSEPVRNERRKLRRAFRALSQAELEALLRANRDRITEADLAAAGQAALQAGLDDLDDDDDDELDALLADDDDDDLFDDEDDAELLAAIEKGNVKPAAPTPTPTPALTVTAPPDDELRFDPDDVAFQMRQFDKISAAAAKRLGWA
jgi:hypothetical protein